MDISLKNRMNSLATRMRRSMQNNVNLNQPRLSEADILYQDGRPARRKRIILRSGGCCVPVCTMCPFVNETLYMKGINISSENYIRQFRNAFISDSIDDYDNICVYNDGNFFADKEMLDAVRDYVYSAIAKSTCKVLTVESLPQFITLQKIGAATETLKTKTLCVGIGLQSANEVVRESCINGSFSGRQFEKAVDLLNTYRCKIKVYVMLKPPFLTETEGIVDAVSSIQYVYSLGIKNVTICPTRISPNTIAARLHDLRLYQPPWLWSIIDVLRQTYTEGYPRVACINLRELDLISIHPQNCDKCSDSVIKAIEEFNVDRDFTKLEELACSCQQNYRRYLDKDRNHLCYEERVRGFLDQIENYPKTTHES